jgi:hypothetical protein
LPNIIIINRSRTLRSTGHWEKRNACKVLVGKLEGKRPLGRPRHGWENNTKMNLRKIGCGGIDWIGLAQDKDQWQAIANTVTKLQVP